MKVPHHILILIVTVFYNESALLFSLHFSNEYKEQTVTYLNVF